MAKSIVFFVARYSRSGVPLAQARLARAFAGRGFRVDYVVGSLEPGVDKPVIEGVRVVVLGKSRALMMFLPVLMYLRRMRPDVIFSAEDHLNLIVTIAVHLARSRAKLSVSSRVTPFDTYSDRLLSKKWVMKLIARPLARRADALVCVSKGMVAQYVTIFGQGYYRCIYNVIVDGETKRLMSEPVEDVPWLNDSSVPVVISAGRLAPEKGFADLIRAMSLVVRQAQARLVILGEGSLQSDLQELIDDLRMQDFVRLIGFRENPYKYFSKASVFVLSSYVEGLPNVLVEAIASGCTPVATNCPTGPDEVLQGGRLGVLVPMQNPEALAAGIIHALASPITEEIRKEIVAPFEERAVIEAHYEALGLGLLRS